MYEIKKNKRDIEKETLKKFLSNKKIEYEDDLSKYEVEEPCDVRYDGTDYQITEGDQEQLERRRNEIYRKDKISYTEIRSTSKIAEMLLRGALIKKYKKSHGDTTLLIDCSSTGNCEWEDLEKELCEFTKSNGNICGNWKEIYAVFYERNIKIFPF